MLEAGTLVQEARTARRPSSARARRMPGTPLGRGRRRGVSTGRLPLPEGPSTVGAVRMNYDLLNFLPVAGIVFMLVIWLMLRNCV